MKTEHVYCVIMAGGIGSRFWPMSRTEYPKQFHDILGTGETLIQMTFSRLKRVTDPERIFVVTNSDYVDLVKEQLPEIGDDRIIEEPQRRNTAPCIAYSSYKIRELDPEANIIVAPSDHLILKEDAFVKAMNTALEQASTHKSMLTVGIKPTRPDTGYGYIQFEERKNAVDEDVKKVKTFTEKPDRELARKFMDSGDFYWNSGIFIWNVNTILKALEELLPEVDKVFKRGEEKFNTPQEVGFIKEAYQVCTNISIDHGVMEKAQNVDVVLADLGWSDLGTWGALHGLMEKDDNGNAVVGDNVMLYDSNDSLVHVPKDKLVVLQGMDDMIVVESDNILLVCRKQDEQKIKQFVNDVKMEKGNGFV